MTMTIEMISGPLKDLEGAIIEAMKKLNVQKEGQLGSYIPSDTALGFVHHLYFGKLKKKSPSKLLEMITKHILENSQPLVIAGNPVKQKQESSTKIKRVTQVKLRKSHADRLIAILETTGNLDLIPLFAPHQSLTQVKKLMIEMVRQSRVDQNLIDTYLKLVQSDQ